jgi:hypothetical protein
VSDFESWLSNTQDRVATAQVVLAEVDRGLVAVEKVEKVVKRTRPALRLASVVILGCLVGLGIVLVARRRRQEIEPEIPDVEPPPEGPA